MTTLSSRDVAAQTVTQPTPAGSIDRFDPSLAGDTFFTLSSADVLSRFALSGAATFSYARDPLVVRRSATSTTLDWVTQQSLLDLQVSAEILSRVKLDLLVPILLTEGGSSGSLADITVAAPSAAHVGDVRATGRVAVVHQDGSLPAVGISLAVWAPTGSAKAFAGAGVARVEPSVGLSGEYLHFAWSAGVGARYQENVAAAITGSQIMGGAAAAVRLFSTTPSQAERDRNGLLPRAFDGLTIGPELTFSAPLGSLAGPTLNGGGTAELLLSARYRYRALSIGLAGGPGFGRAPGSPTYRLLAGIGGNFDILGTAPTDDADAEARRQANLAAQKQAEAMAVDTDGDGIPDTADACPRVAGVPSADPKKNGCPADRDNDGIPDSDDACPDVPGVPNADPKQNGCPPDSDGDGIPDDKDACPHDKGVPSADPTKNGCPVASLVRVEGTQIVILQQVHFESGKDTIQADSFGLLGEVAAAMRDHPEIARVAVDGHTDDRGGDKPNKSLSERRALSVVRWLVDHGVDARRLEARGFGQRRPIGDNKTEEGRAKNRRVEFLIRRRTELGEKGWLDGPVDDVKASDSRATPGK